ncbi:MAG TPA: hypothetical protein DCX79_04535 [Planctomycetaceae bacterium]|nr:hypothetical protein [Planctomycetaceae bacterium]
MPGDRGNQSGDYSLPICSKWGCFESPGPLCLNTKQTAPADFSLQLLRLHSASPRFMTAQYRFESCSSPPQKQPRIPGIQQEQRHEMDCSP